MHSTETVAEARRQMEICNACRYCEGYCAVFPAMERRRQFSNEDLGFLANLCHGCKGCFHACQYAPPHPFAVNVPQTFARLRTETYAFYAWPQPLAGLFRRNGLVVALVVAAATTLIPVLTAAWRGTDVLTRAHAGPGAFYAVIPWPVMSGAAGAAFVYALLALVMGGLSFWKDLRRPGRADAARAAVQATGDVLTLRNLGGGGHGCNDIDASFSATRRWLHQAMLYGFALCFAATSVGWFMDTFLGQIAPYPLLSPPVILGTVGGVGLAVGSLGLFAVKLVTDPAPDARELLGADVALLLLLAAVSISGLLLLALRSTGAMGLLLCVHLGLVLGFFVLTPYSKMVHGLYRSLALLHDRLEQASEAVPRKAPEEA